MYAMRGVFFGINPKMLSFEICFETSSLKSKLMELQFGLHLFLHFLKIFKGLKSLKPSNDSLHNLW
jgi:hypothetical protein